MISFYIYSALFMCILIFLCLYRAVLGPTVFDRIIGAGFIGTKTVVILLLIGFIYKRIDMFIDLAVVYSILNFIGTLIISKYFLKRGSDIE
jgi:multicomponent Na+:H+ antiporter subunit F